MTIDEARQAYIDQARIVHNCRCSGCLIVYKRIKEYKHVTESDGRKFISVGLVDDNERCMVWDEPQNIELYDENKPLDRDHYFATNTRQPC